MKPFLLNYFLRKATRFMASNAVPLYFNTDRIDHIYQDPVEDLDG